MKIAFVCQYVGQFNPSGEALRKIMEALAENHDVTLFAYRSSEVKSPRITRVFVPCLPFPRFLGYLTFHLGQALVIPFYCWWKRKRFEVVQGIDSESLWAQVITLHYCNAERMRLVRLGRYKLPDRSLKDRLKKGYLEFTWTLTAHLERWVYNRSRVKYLIGVSGGIMERVQEHYAPLAERTVIPNAIDLERFSPDHRETFRTVTRERHHLSPDDLVLLFVAQSRWEAKGLSLLLKALSLLPQAGLKLLVVGPGDIGAYAQQARDLGIRDRVVFVGPTRDVHNYYAAADVFVLPSAFEACSLVCLEALASGLPILVTPFVGSDLYTREGKNGFYIDYDPQDIAEKIQRLAEDPGLRERMGRAGRETALGFSLERVARRTEEVYRRVAERSLHRNHG